MTVVVPAATGSGTYYILATADGASAVSETYETNNVRLGWIRVSP